jgi:signal transduction histidine kinase
VTVTDTGPGIPAAAAGRIFDVFWRGDVAGTQVPTSGSGMGLAAAQAFTKLMKGELLLKDSSMKGSTFVLRLPTLQ